MHKLASPGLVLHELFKNDQPINMKVSLADPRAFSHPAQAKKALGTRLRGHVCFEVDRYQVELFDWIAGSRQANQGWVVRKPINSKPELKDNRSVNFSCVKLFSLLMFCVVLDYSNPKQKA